MQISWKTAIYIPNILSISRIFMIPVIAWLLARDTLTSNLWAASLMIVAALTDLLDGFLARLLNQQSDLGKLLDPLADKLFAASFVTVLLLIRDFPLWFMIIIIGKDIAIALGGWYVMKRHDIVMQSKLVGKYAFTSQVMLIISYYIRFSFGKWFFTILTLVLIAATMVSYYYSFRRRMAGKPGKPEFTLQTRRMFLFLRLWFLALGAVIVMFHVWFWLFESPYCQAERHETDVQHSWELRLAERYAPVLLIGEEGIAPVNPDAYFENALFAAGSRFFGGSFDITVSREEALSRKDSYILGSIMGETPDDAGITSFWHINELPGNTYGVERAVVYWFLFPHQHVPLYREGIWRAFIVYLDAGDKPVYAAVTREWHAEAVSWGEVAMLEDEHPGVFVGENSAAFAFTHGTVLLSFGPAKLLPVFSDEVPRGNHFHPGVEYFLKPFTDEVPWHRWKGLWGGPKPGGDLGPRWWNPKNTRLRPYQNPLELLRHYLQPE